MFIHPADAPFGLGNLDALAVSNRGAHGGIPAMKLVAGREFNAQDQLGSPLVAIVSEGFARRLWANADAIGRVLEFDGRRHVLVGVVEDVPWE